MLNLLKFLPSKILHVIWHLQLSTQTIAGDGMNAITTVSVVVATAQNNPKDICREMVVNVQICWEKIPISLHLSLSPIVMYVGMQADRGLS